VPRGIRWPHQRQRRKPRQKCPALHQHRGDALL
jgi:hypothetical protein